MKNTRNYRLPALLLAVIMIFGILPTTATAAVGEFSFGSAYVADVTELTSFTFVSGEQEVGSVDALDPSKASKMIVNATDSDNMFAPDGKGEMLVDLPENVEISGEDAAACESNDVSCSYRASKNQLVFKWKGEKKSSFTATLLISPNLPDTLGLSGKHVIATIKNNKFVGAVKAQTRNDKRLVTTTLSYYDDKLSFDDNSAYLWTFTHVSGDWYTISNGSYIKMQGNALTLTSREDATIFHIRQEASGYVIESNGYYLNIKSDNASNGMQGSNWSPMQQYVYLYSASDLFDPTNGNLGYVKLSANGGNAALSTDLLKAEPGSTVTLPNYTGTKNSKQFIGWAKYANIYEFHDGNNNSYCEVYLPGTEYPVSSGIVTLYAVFNEKNASARFGIRKDGTIPHEPGDHNTNEYYSYHETIQNSVKIGRWVVDVDGNKEIVGNHIENAVTANLTYLPSDEQIKMMCKDYDPETMYVHWYVMKYAGQWKIDGVIRTRASYSVGYDMNMEGKDRSNIENMPKGYEFGQKATIKVGAGKDGIVKTPTLEGYKFIGWNTESKGNGTSYSPEVTLDVSSSITFYAQWEKLPSFTVSYTVENAGKNADLPESADYLEDNTVTLAAAKDRDGYIFSGWMINGEKIEGNSFTMPGNEVEIKGIYYGPIDVEIRSNWDKEKIPYRGAKITMTAVVSAPDEVNLDYAFQWEYRDGDQWLPIEGANEISYTYELDEETSGRTWRVVVTDAWLHQD